MRVAAVILHLSHLLHRRPACIASHQTVCERWPWRCTLFWTTWARAWGPHFETTAGFITCRAMIMNVNEPETRGVALALHVVLDDLGKGVGPALVAVLITALGRQLAFSLSITGWIPCGLLIREWRLHTYLALKL